VSCARSGGTSNTNSRSWLSVHQIGQLDKKRISKLRQGQLLPSVNHGELLKHCASKESKICAALRREREAGWKSLQRDEPGVDGSPSLRRMRSASKRRETSGEPGHCPRCRERQADLATARRSSREQQPGQKHGTRTAHQTAVHEAGWKSFQRDEPAMSIENASLTIVRSANKLLIE